MYSQPPTPVIVGGGGWGQVYQKALVQRVFDSFSVKPEGTGHHDLPGSLRLVTTEPPPSTVQHHWYLLE